MMASKIIRVDSGEGMDVKDITSSVQEFVSESGMREGVVNVFVKGSTGSVSTMEYEPNLKKDIQEALEGIAPSGKDYHHHKTWGDRNGNSHVRATLMGPGTSVPFSDGRLLLGQWQQVVLLDFDVPARKREIVLTVIGEK